LLKKKPDSHIEKQTMLHTEIQRRSKRLRKTCSKKGGKGKRFYPIRGSDASTTRGNVQGEQGRFPGQIYRSTVAKRAE